MTEAWLLDGDVEISIVAHSECDVVGQDSTVLSLPPEFGVEAGGVLNIGGLTAFLRRLVEVQAAALGERLHHADFRLTTNADYAVEVAVTVHDCIVCRAAAKEVREFMAANPGQQMLVGMLYWAGNVAKSL